MTADHYAYALSKIPGLSDLDETFNRLSERQKELATPPAYHGQTLGLANELVAAIREGKPTPTDLGRRAFDAENTMAIHAAEKRIVELGAQLVKDERTTLIQQSTTPALLALREVIVILLGEARDLLPVVSRLADAEDAIDTGPEASAAWVNFSRIARDYQAVRKAQRRLVIDYVGGSGGLGSSIELKQTLTTGVRRVTIESLLDRAGEISNYGEIYPDWVQQARNGDTDATPAFEFDGAPEVHLRQLLSNEKAEIWLPTVDEARKAFVVAYEQSYEHGRAGREARSPHVAASRNGRDISKEIQVHKLAEQLRGSATNFMGA